jgi:phosphotransferase system  glucose/maltose/N-acetylglucosamine-specific IIC component
LNSEDLIKAYSAKNNDMMFAIYICAMTRCILSLHTLLFIGKDNQEKVKEREQELEKQKEKEKEKKEK